MPTDDAAPTSTHRTSPALLIIAWLAVGIPAAWGVTQTVKRSMDLFRSPPPSPRATTVPTTTTAEEVSTTAPTTTPAGG